MKKLSRVLILGTILLMIALPAYAKGAGTDFIYTTVPSPTKEAYIFTYESNIGGSVVSADYIIRMQNLTIAADNSSAAVEWSIETESKELGSLINGTDIFTNVVYASLDYYTSTVLLAAALGALIDPTSVLYIVAVNATDGTPVTGQIGNYNVSVTYDRATGVLRELSITNLGDDTYITISRGALPEPIPMNIWFAYVVVLFIVLGSITYILIGNKKGGNK